MVCGGDAATWAAAGVKMDAGKARGQQRDGKRNADRTQLTATGGVWVRLNVPRWLHRFRSVLYSMV